jgi:hypothetical protein
MSKGKPGVKKVVIFLLLLILSQNLLLEMKNVKASTTTVTIGSISLNPNQNGDIPIRVLDISSSFGLGSYDISIIYDPTVVEVTDVTGGDYPFNSVTENILTGRVNIVYFIYESPGPTGSITIAHLKVKAIGTVGSQSNFDFINVLLYDSLGDEIPANSASGSINIIAPTPPKPSSSISLLLDKSEMQIDDAITMTGLISPARLAQVTLTLTRPDGSHVTRAVLSEEDGSYAYTYTPDMYGQWTVTASWPGDSNLQRATSSPAAFTVMKQKSSVSLSLFPRIILPEGQTTISGTLTPPHAGAEIKIEYRIPNEEWQKITDVYTDAYGEFSFLWETLPTALGEYELKASWQGDLDHEGSDCTLPFYIGITQSEISLNLSCNSSSINNPIVIRGHIFPLCFYANVSVLVKAPNGDLTTYNLKTDSAGNYKLTLILDTVGTWSFKAIWQGDSELPGAESPETNINVTMYGSSIELNVNPATTIGNAIVLSGKVMPAPETSNVTLTLTKPDNTLTVLQNTINNGSFSFSYIPDQIGVWLAEASWHGNQNSSGATSIERQILVQKIASSITLFSSPPMPKKNDLITLKGVLNSPISADSTGIYVSDDEGKTWNLLGYITVGNEGEFQAFWRADQLGTFMFRAEFSGDGNYSGCQSEILTLVICENLVHVPVMLLNGEECRVLLSTGLPVSNVSVDAPEGKIELGFTEIDGATRTIQILIPDNLLNSSNSTIHDLVFTADGAIISPDIKVSSESFIVTICCDEGVKSIQIFYLTYSLDIFAKDYNGDSLNEAVILLDGVLKQSGITNSSGIAHFSNLPIGNYTINVFFGLRVGESSVYLDNDTTLSVSTEAGKIYVEYTDLQEELNLLQNEYHALANELNGLKNFFNVFIFYISAMILIILIASILTFEGKKRLLRIYKLATD